MKLSKLLEGVVNQVSSDFEIRGITDDSREVKKGYLFVAVKGLTVDGHDFIKEAIKNGALFIVGEKSINNLKIYLKVPNSRIALGIIAGNWYGNSSNKLKVIGITGTKGKTSTCFILYHMLSSLGKKAGMITSLGLEIDGKKEDTGYHVTTSGVISLHKYLNKIVEKECEFAIIEVSSHGIDQKRIAGINFEVAALTNIRPEHLDYHKTFCEYKKVKLSFVRSAKLNVIGRSDAKIKILPGVFNNLNAQTALDVIDALGLNKTRALESLKTFKLPQGRMEYVKNNKGLDIIIDFAHTPDSLENILNELRGKCKGRLICIFGCAGERDTRKRPIMGRIAGNIADIVVLTAEDPRNENVNEIISEIESGVIKSKMKLFRQLSTSSSLSTRFEKYYFKIPDRGEAIHYAINKIAKKGDTIVVCGKGHEKSMCFGKTEYPWSDREAIELAFEDKIFNIDFNG